MMKLRTMTSLVLTLLMILSLAACGGTGAPIVEPNDTAATTTAPAPVDPTTTTPVTSQASITEEQAKAIALEDANLTADAVDRLTVEYDIDDGVPEYHVEFYEGGTEYDYEIHAETGAIRSRDRDRNDGVFD